MNAMYLVRPSSVEMDAWNSINGISAGSAGGDWRWDGMYSYMKQSENFTAPNDALLQYLPISYDASFIRVRRAHAGVNTTGIQARARGRRRVWGRFRRRGYSRSDSSDRRRHRYVARVERREHAVPSHGKLCDASPFPGRCRRFKFTCSRIECVYLVKYSPMLLCSQNYPQLMSA